MPKTFLLNDVIELEGDEGDDNGQEDEDSDDDGHEEFAPSTEGLFGRGFSILGFFAELHPVLLRKRIGKRHGCLIQVTSWNQGGDQAKPGETR